MAHTPTFHVTVVSRSVQAVNYKHRGGATKVDFAGTDLMPQARGKPKPRWKARRVTSKLKWSLLNWGKANYFWQ